MLYKFKSRATADLILLDAQGRRLLKILGKEPTTQGIVTVAQIPAAIAALEAAVADEERDADSNAAPVAAKAAQTQAQEAESDMDGAPGNRVSLRQRAAPFIDMLRRSAAENADVVWGV